MSMRMKEMAQRAKMLTAGGAWTRRRRGPARSGAGYWFMFMGKAVMG